jgi:8-oxo-dGTP diphosphatase
VEPAMNKLYGGQVMQGYNVIMVYNKDMDRLLMCKRLKNPYKGLSNLVGGKIENGERGIDAAYRELQEETGISKEDITLHHLMDFIYYFQNCYVEVYVGKLNRDVNISGDENELYWSDLNKDFFDMSLYAGEGNIGHMIEQVKISKILTE